MLTSILPRGVRVAFHYAKPGHVGYRLGTVENHFKAKTTGNEILTLRDKTKGGEYRAFDVAYVQRFHIFS